MKNINVKEHVRESLIQVAFGGGTRQRSERHYLSHAEQLFGPPPVVRTTEDIVKELGCKPERLKR